MFRFNKNIIREPTVCASLKLQYWRQLKYFVIELFGRAAARPNSSMTKYFNPLNPELNPIYYLLALLGAHHFLHVSRIRVKLLTFRRLMSYIYMEHPFLMFLDHTQRRSTVGRTPLDE